MCNPHCWLQRWAVKMLTWAIAPKFPMFKYSCILVQVNHQNSVWLQFMSSWVCICIQTDVLYFSGTQPMVLVSFVTLWPKNFDTWPLFLRDTFDAKMFRKWHPGKPNAKYTCQAISPVHYVQSYSRTQRTLLFLENVRTFPVNTTKFINSSDLISLKVGTESAAFVIKQEMH